MKKEKSIFNKITKIFKPKKEKLINSICFRPLRTSVFNLKVVDEETEKIKKVRIRTNASKIVKEKRNGIIETYIQVESIIYCDNKYSYNQTKIKL